jgi:hypothetical protein
VVLAELAASVEWVALVVQVELAVPAAVARAELATDPRNYQQVAPEPVIDGSITRNIAAALPIKIAQPQTASEARRAVIPLPAGRQAHGNSSVGKAAISRAIAQVEPV